MEIPQKLDLKDILGLYSGRRDEDEPLPPVESLNIDNQAFQAHLKNAARVSAAAFENSEVLMEGLEIEEGGGVTSRTSLLCHEVVDASVPLSLVVTYQQAHTKTGGRVPSLLKSSLYKGELEKQHLNDIINHRPLESKPVAEMVTTIKGNEFDLAHRIVRPEFRRQGLGDAMLQFLEEFLRAKGEKEGNEQVLSAMVAQLDVICWLWNSGYGPNNSDDQSKLEKILSGDSELCIGKKLYVFPKNVPAAERGSVNMHNSGLHMKLVKRIQPGMATDIKDMTARVKSSLNQIL